MQFCLTPKKNLLLPSFIIHQQIYKNLHCLAVLCLTRTVNFWILPSWAPVANFCRKTALRAVFQQKLATGAHDGRNQKLTVHTPPNNENNFKKFYRSFETVKSMNFMHCSACTHRFSSLSIDLTVELHPWLG